MELERAASNPKFAGIAGEGALLSFLNEVALMSGDDMGQERKQREEAEAAAGRPAEARFGEAVAAEAAKPPMIQLMTVHASTYWTLTPFS